jgi:acyl-CoA thioesterase-1
MFTRIILFCWLALAPLMAPAATVLVYGDSLSAAYGLPQELSWPQLLARRLGDQGYDYKVANASISGETTLGGATRIDEALKKYRPDAIVLALGANDGLRGQSLDAMRRNLEAMIDAARRERAQVLLVGMRLPPNYGMSYAEKFQRTFAEVAKAKRVPLVPFLLEGFGEDRALFQGDGLHPTAQAQPRILDTVWPGLRPLLKR